MSEAQNTINEVMSLDPLKLSDQNLNQIIAYSRKQRMLIEGGKKPKRGAQAESEEQIDLQALGLVKKTNIKRRV